MAENRLPFAEIRRIFGEPQVQVEVNARVWRLHLVDGQHDRPGIELLFEHGESGLPALRLRVDEDHFTREHAAALLRRPWWNRQERFDKNPQRIWKQHCGHTGSRYFADENPVSEVLLRALSVARSASVQLALALAAVDHGLDFTTTWQTCRPRPCERQQLSN